MKFFPLVVAIALAISLGIIAPITIAQGSIDQEGIFVDQQIRDLVTGENAKYNKLNANGVPTEIGSYYITLKNETFDPLNNDPKFDNPNQFLPSAIPERQEQIVPELQHEYTVKTGEIIYDKVEQYNGTTTSSLSPLKVQGGYVDEVYSHAIKGFMVKNVDDISIFVNDPDIALVEEVKIPIQALQYRPANAIRLGHGQQPVVSGFRPDGIEQFPNVDIALLDEAVWRTHPDLNVAGSGTQCYVPSGWTCYPPSIAHGTMSAGIMAARDNLGGVSGSAAGARVWSYAICGRSTSGSSGCGGNTASALDHVEANAAIFEVTAIVLTLSCGWQCTASTTSTTSNNAINSLVSAGVTVVTAAGNDGTNADNKSYCNASSVICVSAMADFDGKCGGLAASASGTLSGRPFTQRDDARAFFSNYGSVVDIMASGYFGSGSLTTIPGGSAFTQSNNNVIYPFIGASIHGYYGTFGGTSEATPWVAGAAAALKSLHPSWTPAQIKSDLQANDIPQEQSCNTSTGLGGLANNPNSGSSEDILNLAAID